MSGGLRADCHTTPSAYLSVMRTYEGGLESRYIKGFPMMSRTLIDQFGPFGLFFFCFVRAISMGVIKNKVINAIL